MKKYINTSNYYLSTLASTIPSDTDSGVFDVADIVVDGVALPEKGYFWVDVDFGDVSKREIFRIDERNGYQLHYDQRISPNGKVSHQSGASVGLRDFSQLLNSLSANTDNFGEIESIGPLKVLVRGGYVFKAGEGDAENGIQKINDYEKTITPNKTTYIVLSFDEEDYQFDFIEDTALLDATTQYPIAKIISGANSISSITDIRSTMISGGDMVKGVYDPNHKETNVFDYNNLDNAPHNVSDLNNDVGYISDSTGIVSALGYTPANQADLGTAAACNTGTSSGNVPVLGVDGKLNTSILPALALTDTFVVTNYSDLTTLSSAEQGDVGIVTSQNKSYILSQSPYSTAANWKELVSGGQVTSVNGQTGAVTVNDVKIGAGAPSNPAEGMIWYNTTNDATYAYDGANWNELTNNVKAFNVPTSGASKITSMQKVYDWAISGKTAIVNYGGDTYFVRSVSSSEMVLYNTKVQSENLYIYQKQLYISISSGGVNTITERTNQESSVAQVLTLTNTTAYTPTADYHPTTKRYVDSRDTFVQSSAPTGGLGRLWYDTSKNKLKAYNGTGWEVCGNDYEGGQGITIIGTEYFDRQGPCPDGFHIPTYDEWAELIECQLNGAAWENSTTGLQHLCTYLKLPFSGLIRGTDGQFIFYNGTSSAKLGMYWTCSHIYDYDNNTWRSCALRFSRLVESGYNIQTSLARRAFAYPIRAFKNIPVEADSSWTTLYDGSATATGAGVFHNPTLGLISIYDGNKWYTIQDKNLGATAVYNWLDALSADNCGYYYQWGNNYGFVYNSSSVQETTTTIKVNNSQAYGPGNYYYRNVFVKIQDSDVGGDWMYTTNNNLWGGASEPGASYTIMNSGVLSINGNEGVVAVNDVKIGGSAPSGAVEGTVWYDTVNDILKVYDGTNWNSIAGADVNTKAFYLSGTGTSATVLAEAQDIYDWYAAGKTPIVILSDKAYNLIGQEGSNLLFQTSGFEIIAGQSNNTGRSKILSLTLSSSTVTSVSTSNVDIKYLDLNTNYQTIYSPTYNGSPATKKYVDDKIDNTAYASSWDGVTDKAPSMNAVYDKFQTLGTAAACNTGTSSGNVPVLDSNGKLDTGTLPGVALTDTFTVSTSSDLVNLTSAEQGDIAIVTTENKTYVLSQAPYSTAANWKEILSPTGGVTSVNGNTGAVTVSEFTPGGTATTGYVVTKTSNGYEWQAPAATGITNNTTGTTTTLSSIWVGTSAEYALITPAADVLYIVY